MDRETLQVAEHVNDYFREHLAGYTVLGIRRKSHHPDDDYLYIVSAKNENNGRYAVWTSWNDITRTLNHGNYGIKSLEDCEILIREYTNDSQYFAVYRYAHKVEERMFVTDSEEKARQFCEDNGYELKDENDFVWSLDYREA